MVVVTAVAAVVAVAASSGGSVTRKRKNDIKTEKEEELDNVGGNGCGSDGDDDGDGSGGAWTAKPDSRADREEEGNDIASRHSRASIHLPKTTPLPLTPLSFRRHSSDPFKIDQSQPRPKNLRRSTACLRECVILDHVSARH